MSTKAPRSTAATLTAPTHALARPLQRAAGPGPDEPRRPGAWVRDFSGVRTRSADQPVPEAGLPQPAREVVRRPGAPLPAAVRADAEHRFRHDFSHVRVHTDPEAARAARALRAGAFTVGHHIAFAAGRFAPATAAGTRLLTHELAHVVQQDLGAAGHADGAAAESEADRIARDPVPGRKVRVGARLGVHRSEDHKVLEEDSRAFYYPSANRPQKDQLGVDLVMGGSAPEYTQTTNPKEGRRVEVTERVTGGTWIQVKRLTIQDDMSMEALQKRIQKAVSDAVNGFHEAIARPEAAKNWPMEGAKREGKTAQGTWNRTVYEKSDALLIHIEVPGLSGKSPAEQRILRETAEQARSGARFGRIPLRIVMVDPPPSARGVALARVKLAGSLSGRLPTSLKVLAAVSALVKVYKAVEFIKVPFAAYDQMLAVQWQAEQAGKGEPAILRDESAKLRSMCALLVDARAEQDTYSEQLRDLPSSLVAIGASGDLDAIRKTTWALVSAWSVVGSRLNDANADIRRIETYKKRAEQRQGAAKKLFDVAYAVRALDEGAEAKQAHLWQLGVDLQHLINLSDNAIKEATELRDRLADDDNSLMAWARLLKEWYFHFEAQNPPAPNAPAAPAQP
ncbi:DUF4157 domain-containing protein [Streptomyces sp. NPDC059991]|uniref:eCIS core domain-containing protein n=1 Tax=Streptomyces sp. NPDC059991 TaxID=3347028 RepID=UPI0036D169EF